MEVYFHFLAWVMRKGRGGEIKIRRGKEKLLLDRNRTPEMEMLTVPVHPSASSLLVKFRAQFKICKLTVYVHACSLRMYRQSSKNVSGFGKTSHNTKKEYFEFLGP